MADYDVLYSFPDKAAAEVGWDYVGPDHTGLQTRDTDGAWCWTDSGSPSSNTGPPSGIACVYTETSSPVTGGDEFLMTLAAAVSAAIYALFVTFNRCVYGNTGGHLYFEAWNGVDWVNIADWDLDGVTTFTPVGPYDFTSYSNADFKIRFRTVVGGTNAYQNDVAIDEVRIYGNLKAAYKLEGITKDKTGAALGNCECYACEDLGTSAVFRKYDESDGVGNYLAGGLPNNNAAHFVIAFKGTDLMDITDFVLEPMEE